MPPRKSTNEQSSIASTSSADKSFSSDSLASKSSNSSHRNKQIYQCL